MTALKGQRQHFPALEGLRGVAILAVIVYHNFPYGDSLLGWLGVDLFFVLSGFLITTILMQSVYPQTEKGFLKRFYIRRVLRIFPLYYLFLFAFLFLFPLLGIWNNEVTEYQENKWWYIFYTQNWLFTNNLPQNSECLNHFWSLAIEEQYYLIWPFIILLLRRPKRLLFFLIAVLILIFALRSYIWYAQYENFNYTTFYRFTRFDGIIIGSIVALIVIIKKDFLLHYTSAIVAALAVLNFVFYFFNSSGQLPYLAFIGYTTFAAMFGILVYELTCGNTVFLIKTFSIKPLRFLGKISYGLYMFHWPVHYFLKDSFADFFTINFYTSVIITQVLTGIVTSAFAVLLSVISFYSFEKYFLNLKKKFE